MKSKSGNRKLFIIIPVILLIVLTGAGYYLYFKYSDTSLKKLQEKESIRIGYAVEAPYAFLTKKGEVTGESPEVAKQIVKKLGIQNILWKQIEFANLIPELEANRIDVIAAGMFITPERQNLVNFSYATFHVQQGLLVLKGNPKQFHSYAHAANMKEIKIAVLSGSVEEKIFRGLGILSSQLMIVPDALTGRIAVESGVSDGLALSSPTVRWMSLEDHLEKTEIAQPFDSQNNSESGIGAFAFRKNDIRLLNAWNKIMSEYIGSPEHIKLISQFGFTSEELPDKKTTAQENIR